MVPADAQADLPVSLEAAVWGGEAEARRAKRVRRGEDYTAMIEAFAVDRVWGPPHGEVPFEEVGIERSGSVVR